MYELLFTMTAPEDVPAGESRTLEHTAQQPFMAAKLHVAAELAPHFLITSICVDEVPLQAEASAVPATLWGPDAVGPPLRHALAMSMKLVVKNITESPQPFACDVLRTAPLADGEGKVIYGFDSRERIAGRRIIRITPTKPHMLESFVVSKAVASALKSLKVKVDQGKLLPLQRRMADFADHAGTQFELVYRVPVAQDDEVALFIELKEGAELRFVATAMGSCPLPECCLEALSELQSART
jgi:hypothetical protein